MKPRKGFGLITAIVIMMTIALLMSMSIGLSTVTTKQTSDLFIKEQAKLLLRSATEYALLAISGHDNKVNCIKNITINYPSSTNPQYVANINIWYIANNAPTTCPLLKNSISTNESNLTTILDVTVEAKSNLGISEPIRIYKRTIQKP